MITLLDSVHNPPQFIDPNVSDERHEKWSQYVASYLRSDEFRIDPKRRHVFLIRNRQKHRTTIGQNVISKNGLECRISLNNYRLFYVDGTEDYFYRQGQLSKTSVRFHKHSPDKESRKKRLEDLISKRFPISMDVSSSIGTSEVAL